MEANQYQNSFIKEEYSINYSEQSEENLSQMVNTQEFMSTQDSASSNPPNKKGSVS